MDELNLLSNNRDLGSSMQAVFACHLNAHLMGDPFLKHIVPLDPRGADFFDSFKDGVLMCRIVCLAIPGSIGTPTDLAFGACVESVHH